MRYFYRSQIYIIYSSSLIKKRLESFKSFVEKSFAIISRKTRVRRIDNKIGLNLLFVQNRLFRKGLFFSNRSVKEKDFIINIYKKVKMVFVFYRFKFNGN